MLIFCRVLRRGFRIDTLKIFFCRDKIGFELKDSLKLCGRFFKPFLSLECDPQIVYVGHVVRARIDQLRALFPRPQRGEEADGEEEEES